MMTDSTAPPLRVMILFRRNVVAAEVDALVAHFSSQTRHTVIVACSMGSLLDLLTEDTRRAATFVTLAGRSMPERLPAPKEYARPASRIGLRERCVGLVRRVLLGIGPARSVMLARSLFHGRRRLRKLLALQRPDAILVFDDRAAYPEMLCLREAKARGIKTVRVPFAASSIESDLWMRRDKQDHHIRTGALSFVKRWLGRRYPAQVFHGTNDSVLFFDLWAMLAMAPFGLLNTSPWELAGGDVDVVGVMGPKQREEVLSQRGETARVQVTGQPSLDSLARLYQKRAVVGNALRGRYGLPSSQPLIVCSVPQYAEHSMLAVEKHAAVTEALFLALARTGCPVLLSLHPKSRRESYADNAAAYRLIIAEEPLREILPAADIFIASYSSTVLWAAIMGIPTVIADFPRLRFSLFADLPEVRVEEDVPALTAELSFLAEHASERRARGAALQQRVTGLGTFDGLACQRVVGILEELCRVSKESRSEIIRI